MPDALFVPADACDTVSMLGGCESSRAAQGNSKYSQEVAGTEAWRRVDGVVVGV